MAEKGNPIRSTGPPHKRKSLHTAETDKPGNVAPHDPHRPEVSGHWNASLIWRADSDRPLGRDRGVVRAGLTRAPHRGTIIAARTLRQTVPARRIGPSSCRGMDGWQQNGWSDDPQVTNPHGIPVALLPDSAVRLLEDVDFSVTEMCGVSLRVSVPRGFRCDGASIPRCLWSIVGHPLDGGPLRAAIVHDFLCEQARTHAERRFADTCFAWIMADSGVPWLQRTVMHLAVRMYAILCWRPRK